MLDRYQHKVKTAIELRDLVGARPRARRVIMCHGVFDIVHPGHIRHLLYAKSKADILIASLTADRFIAKGVNRPHVPQDLRAFNLAALEAVDYVVIDDNAEPIREIVLIEPDFFAKGFEYATDNVNTQNEAAALHAYGGEILFTPGDIVYSSSKLITMAPPSLRLTKLQATFDKWNVTFDKLRVTIDCMKGKKVHVVGDTIVDGYTHCTLAQGQPKTPTIGSIFGHSCEYVGGAAVVAKHLAAAGAYPTFSTVLGDDRCGSSVVADLLNCGINCHAVIDKTRPTTQKHSYVVDGHRVLKVDTLDNSSISDHVLAEMTGKLAAVPTDGIVFSDFRHGIFNQRTIPAFIDAIPRRAFRAADSQVATRWGNICDFADFDLITPNEREARHALGDQDSGIRPLVSRLYDTARCGTCMLKLGDRGVITCRGSDHGALDSFVVVDGFADVVVDAVGAGDALLAYATLAMMTGAGPVIASVLGSMAAAIKVGRDGNVAVTADDVRGMIDATEEAMNEVLHISVLYGQGGMLTSLGMVALSKQIRNKFGDKVNVAEYGWTEQQKVVDAILRAPRDEKKAVIGYSLGASSIPPIANALKHVRDIALAIAYDPSIWSPYSRVITPNVKRCILYHGTGLSFLGHALFTGPTVETLNVFDLHEVMQGDQYLHDLTLGYIGGII